MNMKLLKSKTAKINASVIEKAIMSLIVLVVLFVAYGTIMPTAQSAGNSMNQSNQCTAAGCTWNSSITLSCRNATGNESATSTCASGQHVVPLSGLFSGTGVVFLIVMIALILLVVKSYLPKKGK